MTWSIKRLGDVCEFVRGITFKPDDVIDINDSNAIGCMRTKNIQADLDISDVWGIPASFVKRSEQFLRPGDILVSTANSWNLVGKCCWVPDLPWQATLGGFISALRSNNSELDNRYLYHWFSYDPVQALVRNCARKTTNISNLSIDQCLALEIPLPQLAEQKRIAAILDQADDLRRKRKQALDRLNQLGQAIFYEMFGAFHADFGGWPIHRLETLVKDAQIGAVRGAAEMGDEKPVEYLRMDSIDMDGGLRFEGLKRVDASEAELSKYGISVGDLLFNTRNSKELVGKTAVVRTLFTGIYNNNILRVRFSNEMTADFLDAFLRTRKGQSVLGAIKSGTTSVFAIYQKSLLALDVPVPPIDLQRRYSDRLRELFLLRKQHDDAVCEASNLFTSVQHRAFRGEL